MLDREKAISIEMLFELLEIDVDAGRLKWKSRPVSHFSASKTRTAEHVANNWNSRYAGTPALNCLDSSGHLCGRIFDQLIYAHRVVFAMTRGHWPSMSIDHINGDPSDNRPCNLRDVSHLENHRNQKIRKNNTSGVLGVSFNQLRKTWGASIMVSGSGVHLGAFKTKEAAIAARAAAEKSFGFHENHGRKAA